MNHSRRMAAVVTAAMALCGPPSATATPGDPLVDVLGVEIQTTEATAGQELTTLNAEHGYRAQCSMIRTNDTLVKWGGHAESYGHAGIASTSLGCRLVVTPPGGGRVKHDRIAVAAGPEVHVYGYATFVPAGSLAGVCFLEGKGTWQDRHAIAPLRECPPDNEA